MTFMCGFLKCAHKFHMLSGKSFKYARLCMLPNFSFNCSGRLANEITRIFKTKCGGMALLRGTGLRMLLSQPRHQM